MGRCLKLIPLDHTEIRSFQAGCYTLPSSGTAMLPSPRGYDFRCNPHVCPPSEACLKQSTDYEAVSLRPITVDLEQPIRTIKTETSAVR